MTGSPALGKGVGAELFTKRHNFILVQIEGLAADKIGMTEKYKFILRKLENVVGKEENAGFPAFSSFLTMFSKSIFTGSLKLRIV